MILYINTEAGVTKKTRDTDTCFHRSHIQMVLAVTLQLLEQLDSLFLLQLLTIVV